MEKLRASKAAFPIFDPVNRDYPHEWEVYPNGVSSCNLKCEYCYHKNNDDLTRSQASQPYPVEELRIFLEQFGKKGDRLGFMGGEPFYGYGSFIIQKIITATRKFGLLYFAYTNGTLLEITDTNILHQLAQINISIDGTKEIHNQKRPYPDGTGSYDAVMRNLRYLKDIRFRGKTLGRLTVTKANPLYDSVTMMSSYFDMINWQFESGANMTAYPLDRMIK